MTHGAVQLLSPSQRAAEVRALRHGGGIALHSAADMDAIEAAGRVVAQALHAAAAAVVAGCRTMDIDRAARAAIEAAGATPAFLGYPHPAGGKAFPAVCCTSVNDEAVHGVPGARELRNGDLVSVDVGVCLDGWHADAAVTLAVGECTPETMALAACAEAALADAIAHMQPGCRWSDIAARMQAFVLGQGHGLVAGWMGHGIGRSVHEAPQVPSFVSAGLRERRDFTLLPGMVLAVEPIVVLGAAESPDADGCIQGVGTTTLSDDWTVVVDGGMPVAHAEHTVAITRHGPRILTTGRPVAASLERSHGGGRR